MTNKALRILIADEQHFYRMKIERLFNQLGYYRIAPAHSLEELLTLIEYGSEPFDLVVINGTMGKGALDLLDFFRDNRQVRHTLIYNGQQARLRSIPASVQQTVRVNHAQLPDLASLQQRMTKIDPRLPFVGTVISVR
ncbi:response regulator [Pseudomonas sp. PB120]|uniref:response regulator n=1 Tax=Pseudomonas sp. PB120 TaxID=2494700 RepID=UPI0012FE2AD3|nr:response regulator [Pseudomonas sp. PB120]MVV47435.1 response regulator [Pseudomonas sp. PB120]